MAGPLQTTSRRPLVVAAILVLLVAAIGGGAYYFYRGKPDASAAQTQPRAKGKGRGGFDPNRAQPVSAEPARKADIHIFLTGLGTVVPLRTVTVRSRVDGELMRVLFNEGQTVKAGDLLAEIDPRPFQVQLAQAEGQLNKDQALLQNARIDLERYQTLFKQDSIAKQQVDTQASLVRQYEGTLRADQAAVDSARLQLTYSRITAPITGRLGLRQVDPGNIVRSGDANGMVVITQLQPISVVFTIPQDQLGQVMKKMADKLPVEVWDRDNRTRIASGMLLTVDNVIDPQTGTVKLKAQLANDDSALFPNQFVNVRMLVDTRRDAITVPLAALQRGSQGNFVYVVKDDGTVSVRPLELGPAEGNRVAVEKGIVEGERVVTDGVDRLREGAKVEIAQRPEPGKGVREKDEARKGRRKKAE